MPSHLDAAVEISLAAGNLLRYHYERKIGFELKAEFDLVTEADRASEKKAATVEVSGGSGRSRTVASTTTPSVPSEPTSNDLRS